MPRTHWGVAEAPAAAIHILSASPATTENVLPSEYAFPVTDPSMIVLPGVGSAVEFLVTAALMIELAFPLCLNRVVIITRPGRDRVTTPPETVAPQVFTSSVRLANRFHAPVMA